MSGRPDDGIGAGPQLFILVECLTSKAASEAITVERPVALTCSAAELLDD